MSLNTIRENKNLAKISEFTVYSRRYGTFSWEEFRLILSWVERYSLKSSITANAYSELTFYHQT